MFSTKLINFNVSSKLSCFSCSILLALFLILSTVSCLEAGGWGKTKEVTEFEGNSWNGVYFEMNGLHLTASIPNYSGAQLKNGAVSLSGQVEDAGYAIITSFNPGFTPPKSLEEFVKMIQDANPNHIVIAIDSEKLGTLYAVDLIPVNQETTTFWRFLTTNDRLIKMGSADVNDNRRLNFFESIRVIETEE